MRCCLEGREADTPTGRIKDTKSRVVSTHQRDSSLQDQRAYLAEVRAGVQRVGNLQQCPPRFPFALLVDEKPRVLVADSDVPRNRLQERDFVVKPGAQRA